MKITIAGSLGNIGRPLTKKLKNAGHEVTVISHTETRRTDIEALGARAAIGSVNDVSFLKNAFTGADAVYIMIPPNIGADNVLLYMSQTGEVFAEAIRDAGVNQVVLLSSIGADAPAGAGPISGLYKVEQLFNKIENLNITFLRAGFFYTNFYANVAMIKGMGIIGNNFPGSLTLPMVHPDDIATAAVEELERKANGKHVRYIISDLKTSAEVAGILGTAIGKPELPWVEFTDEQAIGGMKQAGLPADMARLYVEMGQGFRNGIVAKHFLESGAGVQGKIKLEEFAKEFANQFAEANVTS